MRTYFRLEWGSDEDNLKRLAELNAIAKPQDGYSWGGDTERCLLWFEGPPGNSKKYRDATARWHDDLDVVGLGDIRITAIEPGG